MEDDIWVPDAAVWHYKEFKRVKGLVKLNELELKVHDECSAELKYAFDFQVKVRCQMVMDWYPYDKKICHVKLGSYSHSSEDLVFPQGEKTSEHTFTKTSYKDLFVLFCSNDHILEYILMRQSMALENGISIFHLC